MKINDILNSNRVACPVCKKNTLSVEEENDEILLRCRECLCDYNTTGGIPLLVPPSSRSSLFKEDIQKFWGELYNVAYEDHSAKYKESHFKDQLKGLKKLFHQREHLAVVEMPIDSVQGRHVLEIGPGAGAHSALFSSQGAIMTSLDITLDRVVETNRKFHITGTDNVCFSLQGDAEVLPFPNNHFDIVYSNGVLHHTPDTQKSIEEVHRVLKPGGSAVIMLYAKHSFLYWFTLFFLKGILLGNMFRYSQNWLGRTTEWMASRKQKVYNPETKVFSEKEILRLFASFNKIEVRKNSFVFEQLPLFGKGISKFIGLFTGYDPAGSLIYDRPWRNESRFELWLGRYMGFALNIKAQKK